MASWSMSPEEFDARGRERRRARPTGRWWRRGFVGAAWTISGAAMWAWIVLAIVWGVMR